METIKEIEQAFLQAESEGTDAVRLCLARYQGDPRKGVQALCQRMVRREEALKAERLRMEEMLTFEKKYGAAGFVCGIDEAGRGPLAGPVVAGAVILPRDHVILYLDDSKKLSPKKREELYDVIKREAVSYGIGMASHTRIDEINILQATYEAMKEAVSKLSVRPDVLLNDAVRIPGLTTPQVPLIHGDARSASIAAASIMAKVTRDRIMEDYAREYPDYGFDVHKGYGTAAHIAALKAYGPCPIHRQSFIRSVLEPAHE